jgi:hypothetical protein
LAIRAAVDFTTLVNSLRAWKPALVSTVPSDDEPQLDGSAYGSRELDEDADGE